MVHLSGYISSQNSRVWSAENTHALHENPRHSSDIGVGARCLENKLWEHCSLKRELPRKVIRIFWRNLLFCWKRMKGVAGFSKMGRLSILRKQR